MVDETDISQDKKWYYEQRAKAAVASLNRRRLNAQYVPSRQEALSAVMEMIPEGATIYRGDSMTLEQIGVLDELRTSKKYKFHDPFARTEDGNFVLEREQRLKMQRDAFSGDVFLTSVNAVTLDGKLVSMDGLGNRVAAMIFGPKKVIVVAGANKIVKDVPEALERIRQVAAPINIYRHATHHHVSQFGELPCVKTGRCADCNHEWKGCNITVIIEGMFAWVKGRINVVLVGEELGI